MRDAVNMLAALSLLMMAANATASLYRWVDDKGRVHYGDQPPPGMKIDRITVDTRRIGTDIGGDGGASDDEAEDGTATDEDSAADDSAAAAADPEACEKARAQLAKYEGYRDIYRDDPIAGRSKLSDEEKERFLDLQRQLTDRACEG